MTTSRILIGISPIKDGMHPSAYSTITSPKSASSTPPAIGPRTKNSICFTDINSVITAPLSKGEDYYILIADDIELNRKLDLKVFNSILKSNLTNDSNIYYVAAKTGEEVLDYTSLLIKAKGRSFHVNLLDNNMGPGISGKEATPLIRHLESFLPENKKSYIIKCTDENTYFDGQNNSVSKPISKEQLYAALIQSSVGHLCPILIKLIPSLFSSNKKSNEKSPESNLKETTVKLAGATIGP